MRLGKLSLLGLVEGQLERSPCPIPARCARNTSCYQTRGKYPFPETFAYERQHTETTTVVRTGGASPERRLVQLWTESDALMSLVRTSSERNGEAQSITPPKWFLAVGALVFLAVAAVYAFSLTFSQFAPYDDQGFL